MKERNLKTIFGIISAILLVTLIIKLTIVPGGLILSGLFLGGIFIVGISIACLLVTLLVKFFLKKYSFLTLYFVIISIAFVAYHYQLYSPTLKIVVPDGYTGEVSFVLSNVDQNILAVDSNGIGYLTKWTFNKTWSKPDVYLKSGKKINDRCVGFNPSTFWGLSKFCCVDGKVIRSLSFEIVPENKIGQKQYYNSRVGLVDPKKLYVDK